MYGKVKSDKLIANKQAMLNFKENTLIDGYLNILENFYLEQY